MQRSLCWSRYPPTEYHGGANIHPAGSGVPCARASGCALKEVASCEDKPTQEQAPGRGHSMWGDPQWRSLFVKGWILWREPPTVAEHDKEGVAELLV